VIADVGIVIAMPHRCDRRRWHRDRHAMPMRSPTLASRSPCHADAIANVAVPIAKVAAAIANVAVPIANLAAAIANVAVAVANLAVAIANVAAVIANVAAAASTHINAGKPFRGLTESAHSGAGRES
jgi:hypothetical protein